jgi:hypothetical protein
MRTSSRNKVQIYCRLRFTCGDCGGGQGIAPGAVGKTSCYGFRCTPQSLRNFLWFFGLIELIILRIRCVSQCQV